MKPISGPSYLTDQELVFLYQTIRDLEADPTWFRAGFLARTALATGLRVSELRNLRTDDFDFGFNPPVVFVQSGKGGKARALNVIPEFTPHLKRARKTWRRGAWVFSPVERLGSRGQCSKRILQYWWECVLKAAGVRHMGIHKGARHTHATWEALRLPIHILRDRLGHANISMTEQYYRHSIVGRDYDQVVGNGPPAWWAEAKILGPDIVDDEREKRVISLMSLIEKTRKPPSESTRYLRCPLLSEALRRSRERVLQKLIDEGKYVPKKLVVKTLKGDYCPWIPPGGSFKFVEP